MAEIMPVPTLAYYEVGHTCREYLGQARGYCPKLPDVTDPNGRGFCAFHASEGERGLL